MEPKDLPIFNKHTHHIRTEILVAIEEYGMVKTTLSKAYEEMEERKEDNDEQIFDDLTSVSDQSVLIPQQEPAVESWDELRKVCSQCVLDSLRIIHCLTLIAGTH